MSPVLEAVAQHVDDAALGDLALEAGQEPAPRRAVFPQGQRLGHLRRGLSQEGGELRQVHAVLMVVFGRIAAEAARLMDQRLGDKRLEAFFSCVSCAAHFQKRAPSALSIL